MVDLEFEIFDLSILGLFNAKIMQIRIVMINVNIIQTVN